MPKTILFWPDVYKEQGHWLPTLKWAEDLSKLGHSVEYMGKNIDMPPKELELLYFLVKNLPYR